ncbi:hypothetical protein [Rubellimicrobium aerolatum]|uniref:Uncharacterized protein n=1 Tax=Rubellimicrobium aerolatum TaxID=490979 RepID=A0ABW0SGI5_9RHOB|nr:hypothetical protein [Rubellimicrobium aerolatum]MBP1807479.1 hypothetical protein [Rubellimicrobium aerolatum]
MRPPESVRRDRDDLTYPVRVRFRVPSHDPGPMLERVQSWLRAELGARAVAHLVTGGDGPVLEAHFLDLGEAAQFQDAFPALELSAAQLGG